MIRVERTPEPEGFEENVRRPGRAWLEVETHRGWPRARPYWNEWGPCRTALADAFQRRCGYLAMAIPSGHVDHFESWAACRESGRHHLAYEWTNYRWLLPEVNQSKQGIPREHLLDPFEVRDGWYMFGLSLERVLMEAPLVGRALQRLMEAPVASLSKELAIFRRRIEASRAASAR